MRMMRFLYAALVTLSAAAAENDSKAIFAKHWQIAKEFTLAVAEAMPAESYDFKPNPEELSFGRLMTHIAAQNSDSCASATGTNPAGPQPISPDVSPSPRF